MGGLLLWLSPIPLHDKPGDQDTSEQSSITQWIPLTVLNVKVHSAYRVCHSYNGVHCLVFLQCKNMAMRLVRTRSSLIPGMGKWKTLKFKTEQLKVEKLKP